MDIGQLLQAAVVGIVTGAFSGGAVWGVLKTEMKWMRRDIDDLRKAIMPWGKAS